MSPSAPPFVPPTILARRKTSDARLSDLRSEVQSIDELSGAPGLCVYVTGSYGRREASEHSDLDLFFLHEGTRQEAGLTAIRETLVQADLVRINRRLGFPEFSGDGRYLQSHGLTEIEAHLGGPSDDYANLFTARLLMLLESQSVHNADVFDRAYRGVVELYFRDYKGHEEAFQPFFLVNDVLRFWKTLCLNYEHRRNRGDEGEAAKNKSRLKNLKLRFSRLNTCFSGVVPLIAPGAEGTVDDVVARLRPTPNERLSAIAVEVPEVRGTVARLLEFYAWFLEQTGRAEEDVLGWIADEDARTEAFEKARAYGDTYFDLLRALSDDDTLRYLVV
ncbi:hypothetical protein RQM47_16910 [Rubrivirga sp. S365]|uniref:nucleotidyltransferase domain-containing protein n=1 Tax=Rubrivirga sp. S365 TaxID=3076080 RepID=UPI0028C98E82|nr:nucleotidyltransferase domain-containing protein [Rubrivirga sp. S365]MDT7858332.1 hypothetical protein [Rubrivirga sp. S365]